MTALERPCPLVRYTSGEQDLLQAPEPPVRCHADRTRAPAQHSGHLLDRQPGQHAQRDDLRLQRAQLRDQPQGGLGIGLALSRRLTELHGGTIEAHSDGVGRGAEFVVRLPLVDLAAPPIPRTATPRHDQRLLRVLIVDDNEDLIEMLSAIVTDLGHEVRKALDGGSAVDAATSYHPDLVLLDLGLPVLSGIEVARELRRRPETSRVCLVAITGWGAPEDRARTCEAGFNHHLTKPVDPEELIQVIAQCA